MRVRTRLAFCLVGIALTVTPRLASAQEPAPPHSLFGATFLPGASGPTARTRVHWRDAAQPPRSLRTMAGSLRRGDAQGPPPAVAFEYSDGYQARARIHRIASVAILPLFAAEGFLGQSLYNNPTQTKRNAHLAVAGGIGGLFGLNTVTGLWNLIEARPDPHGRSRRWVHGLLMLGADAGFLATAMLAPRDGFRDGQFESTGSRSAHRAVAFTSISMATASYLVMLLGGD